METRIHHLVNACRLTLTSKADARKVGSFQKISLKSTQINISFYQLCFTSIIQPSHFIVRKSTSSKINNSVLSISTKFHLRCVSIFQCLLVIEMQWIFSSSMNISLIFRTISRKSFNFTLFELSFPAIFPGQVGCKSDEQCRATDVNTSCIDRICVCEEGKKAVDSVCVNGTVFTQRNEHCMIWAKALPQSSLTNRMDAL